LSAYLDNTDNQNLSLSGNTLEISNGTGVSLSSYLDNTDSQNLTLSGTTLNISGGTGVNLSSIDTTVWTKSGSIAYYNSGNVGIGTMTPTQKLQVYGNVAIGGSDTAYLQFRNLADTDHASIGISSGGIALNSKSVLGGNEDLIVTNS